MIKRNITENNKFYVSPLEVRHFILDIPITKNKYRYNAVKFALRSLYPGSETTSVIDYILINKTLIGIAANSERISELKEKQLLMLSPALIMCQIVKNGIAVYAGKGWIELQYIENGTPKHLQVYSEKQIKTCIKDFSDFAIDLHEANDKILYLFEEADSNIISEFKENSFEIRYINNYANNINIKDAALFIEKKKNNGLLLKAGAVILFFVLLAFDFSFYFKSRKLNTELEEIKQSYQLKKQSMLDNNSITDDLVLLENEVVSTYDILVELYNSSPNIRIISFSRNMDTIKFEAEKASAINVLEQLSKSCLFKDVVLHQALPQSDGSERFLISAVIIK